MFTAIFEIACPFAAYIRNSHTSSFIRLVDYVRHAAINYNRAHGFVFSFDENVIDEHCIMFDHIHVYDERNDLGEVAHMVFSDYRGNKWVVTIVED